MPFEALRSIFGRKEPESDGDERAALVGPRIPRHSTGWSAMLKHLKEEDGLQILDIGPTSASNVNLLTGLGHSLYMADLVRESRREEWRQTPEESPSRAEVFLDQNLNFGERRFDIVLLWTTLDFIPTEFVTPMIARLHSSLNPNGRLLAFFHTRASDTPSVFYRFHVTDIDSLELQQSEKLPLTQVQSNRSIEKLFSAYANCKFFLAKDNVAEVIVTR